MPVPEPESRLATAVMGKVFQIKSQLSYSNFSYFLIRKMEKAMRSWRLPRIAKLSETKVKGILLDSNVKKIIYESTFTVFYVSVCI